MFRRSGGAPSGRALQAPKAPSDEGAVSRQADWVRDAGGHMGPPLQELLRVQHRTNGGGKYPPYKESQSLANQDGRVGDPPLRRCRTVIRHCEEGHGPDVAIRFSVNRGTDSHGPSGASE